MTPSSRPLDPRATTSRRDDAHIVTALVDASAHARWPDGSLVVDLDESVLRALVAPLLLAALADAGALHDGAVPTREMPR